MVRENGKRIALGPSAGCLGKSELNGSGWGGSPELYPFKRSQPSEPDLPDKQKCTVLIHERRFTRECFTYGLKAFAGPESVRSFETVAECAAAKIDPETVVLLVLNVGSRSPSEPKVERELSELRRLFPAIPAILLSDLDDTDHIVEALERGANGFLPTSASIDVAVEAMSLVRVGGTFAPASCLLSLSARCASLPRQSSSGPFTERQKAVLQGLRRGIPNKVIAYELAVSESTVKVHVRNIMRKLRATNRTEVAFLTRDFG